MLLQYPKLVLFLVLLCLIGVGAFYFSNAWKGDDTQIQTIPNLKLLNSHSQPEAGDEWVVSFETMGNADLTITPTDLETIGDLDFISLTCEGKEKTEEGILQVLAGDAVFYSGWQCDGREEVIHLVNIARKHTLKFQFGDKAAFAYNDPDSVTDTFEDESKIDSKENITVSGGQVYLATCGDNGAACSAGGECCSGNCQNSVCCATGQTCCSLDAHCPADSCLATCQKRDHYCDSTTDHYCKYTDAYLTTAGKVCSGGSEVAPTSDNNCDYAHYCIKNACYADKYWRGCAAGSTSCTSTGWVDSETNYNAANGKVISVSETKENAVCSTVSPTASIYCGTAYYNDNNCQFSFYYRACNGSGTCRNDKTYAYKGTTTTCLASKATRNRTSCDPVSSSNYCGYSFYCTDECWQRTNYYGCNNDGINCEGTVRATSDFDCCQFTPGCDSDTGQCIIL